MARTAEAVLVGAGLALAALAAAVAEGLPLTAPLAWGTAAGAGGLMGISWLVDLRPRAERIARDVDRALRLDGALFTAWELEERGRSNALGALLARRVRERVRSAQVVRCALPNALPTLIVPFLGGALLAWVCELRADADRGATVAPAVSGVVAALSDAHAAALDELARGTMDAGDLRALADLTRSARELAATAAHADGDESEASELAAGLEELARRIDELARERATSRELAESLDRAATLADAALAGIGGGDPAPAGDGGDAASSEGGQGPAPSAPPGGGSGAGDNRGTRLANDGRAGTMSAPSGEGGASRPQAADAAQGADGAPPPTPRPAGSAGGMTLDRWWPRRHADLAGRWVEARRAEDAADDDPPTNRRD